jgi:hypothetical protein
MSDAVLLDLQLGDMSHHFMGKLPSFPANMKFKHDLPIFQHALMNFYLIHLLGDCELSLKPCEHF